MAAKKHQDVAPQQQRGVVLAKKQKVAAAEDGKNRRALGDIGNVVNHPVPEGKLLPQINRPVTRGFGAILAKAQAAGANKKPVAILDEGAVKGRAIKGKENVTEPHEIIEISPDTVEKYEQASVVGTISSPKKKKVCTLTSVLIARSKAACGVTDKPRDPVHDIDALDRDDQLAVTDYVDDIYKFFKLSENSSRPHDYMDSQVEISSQMRAILADWLIEAHQKFDLRPESLYLTLYIIDRYLSLETVRKRELQLVGVSAMLIACKYEEIWAPEVQDFICISNKAYTREQILAKEKVILNKIEWRLTVPTQYVFLLRFLKASLSDKEMEQMVFFFAELGLMQYSMIMYCPSMVAAAAVYAARCTLQKTPLWNETLKRHTGFSEPQLLGCAEILLSSHSAAPESKMKVVYKKYSSAQFGAVALRSPATKLLEHLRLNLHF